MQFLPQFLQPLLYLRIEGIFFSEGLIDFVGLLNVTLLEIDFSKCLCGHLPHTIPAQKPS